jgi:hypothetical protein
MSLSRPPQFCGRTFILMLLIVAQRGGNTNSSRAYAAGITRNVESLPPSGVGEAPCGQQCLERESRRI